MTTGGQRTSNRFAEARPSANRAFGSAEEKKHWQVAPFSAVSIGPHRCVLPVIAGNLLYIIIERASHGRHRL
jgi:hypothetical protein